jgi:hypothetical protein
LKSLKNNVKAGDEFDRWDIQNSVGLFGSARSLMTIEECGMGKQMIKIRGRIKFPVFWTIVLLGFVLISLFAFEVRAYFSFSFFMISAILLGLKILTDISGTIGSLYRVMKNLPDGIKAKKQKKK